MAKSSVGKKATKKAPAKAPGKKAKGNLPKVDGPAVTVAEAREQLDEAFAKIHKRFPKKGGLFYRQFGLDFGGKLYLSGICLEEIHLFWEEGNSETGAEGFNDPACDEEEIFFTQSPDYESYHFSPDGNLKILEFYEAHNRVIAKLATVGSSFEKYGLEQIDPELL